MLINPIIVIYIIVNFSIYEILNYITLNIMGACNSTQKHREKAKNESSAPCTQNTESVQNPLTKNDISKQRNPNFFDFPEWEGERYSGVGIKRMKGYKCDLPIDELNNLRDEFWESKIKINTFWRNIRQGCILDHSNLNYE
jgi:hypothetical protein